MTDEELVKLLRDFADDGYADLSIAAADRIEALTEQLEAARADAKEAEAYAEELARDLVKSDNDIDDLKAKLAKAVEALKVISQFNSTTSSSMNVYAIWKMADRARATLAEIEGEKG
jgi:predicted  nucleic acid-binding Zn-ribbon protein